MKQITWLCILALLTACAPPEPETPMSGAPAPATAKVGDAEMLAESIILPETCDISGDGIGGTGCPVD